MDSASTICIMKRLHLEKLPVFGSPVKGTNGWILRTRKEVLYLCTSGILQETKSGLWQKTIVDGMVQPTVVCGMLGHMDSSHTALGEQVWRLPPEYVTAEIEERVFAPRAIGPVRVVFTSVNKKPHDVYFEVDAGTDDATVNEDVGTLLSGLKSCGAYTACSA